MGFYGNITNTNRTQFVFDKTYQNRKQMEANIAEDGVFIGRYVLVDYDKNFPGKAYARLYIGADGNFYFSSDFSIKTRALWSEEEYYIIDSETDEIVGIHPDKELENTRGNSWANYTLFNGEPIYVWNEEKQIEEFYSTGHDEKSGVYAIFTKLDKVPDGEIASFNFYHENYLIDQNYYGTDVIGRGWDSTVWQKVYTDDTEKYVLVAELNSVVPTFGITVDPPALNPIPPHFDADSSSLYYNLHIAPNWAFRVAKAKDENLSDEELNQQNTYWDPDLKKWQSKWYRGNGAIYYNKDGFDKDYRTDKSALEVEDGISVNLIKSGYEYNKKHQGESYLYTNNDTQELSILLPSLGNSISEFWDLVYGTGDQIDDTNQYRRNTVIDWNTVSGERLVEEDAEKSGFFYSPKKTETLAGCINSVHDLMGMIISDQEHIEIEDALVNRIYYGAYDESDPERKGFFMKMPYQQIVDPDKETGTYRLVEHLVDSKASAYYYKDNNNFYFEDASLVDGNKYYILKDAFSEKTLYNKDYAPNLYYKTDSDNTVPTLAKEKDFNDENDYYILSGGFESIVDKDAYTYFYPTDETYFNKYFKSQSTIDPDDETKRIGNGLFYKDKDPQNPGAMMYFPFNIKNAPAYKSTLYWVENYVYERGADETGEIVGQYDFDKYPATVTEYTMVPFESGVYFYEDIDENNASQYKPLVNQADIDISKTYKKSRSDTFTQVTGQLDENGKRVSFYRPNTYYYKKNKDYYLGIEDHVQVTNKYYELDESKIEVNNYSFYAPNFYYYKDADGSFQLDINPRMDPSRDYYLKFDLYIKTVTKDLDGITKGAKWHVESEEVPEGITLGVPNTDFAWKELKGFGRSLNTINGLILQINRILATDNDTRDTNTIQGCINTINDLIARFTKVIPYTFMAVDKYGRYTNATFDNTVNPWINISIADDDNYKEETFLNVAIEHKDPVVSGYESKQSEDPAFGESFEIEDNYFDAKGHKFATETHTVTIPQGSLDSKEEINNKTVLTNLDFEPASGKIITSKGNLEDVMIAENETLGSRLSSLNSSIESNIDILKDLINNETTERNRNDNLLNQSLNNETGLRINGDNAIKELVNKEISDRSSGDEILQQAINSQNTRISSLETKSTTWDLAEQNVQSDWEEADTSSDAYILNKPDLSKVVQADTKITYRLGEEKTIEEMWAYISILENRLTTAEEKLSIFVGD